MKKRFFSLFCIFMLLLSACAAKADSPADGGQEEQQGAGLTDAEGTRQVSVFVPDAQAEYLTGSYVDVPARESLPEMLINGLAAKGALPETVKIIECAFQVEEGRLRLDLNSAYLDALEAGGSAGESMTLYAVVNTFLFNYPTADSFVLTVEGKTIETEHGVYADPFTEMQYLRE